MGAEQFQGDSPENRNEKIEVSAEQYEKSKELLEKNAEQSRVENGERSEEKARIEALEQAVSVEAGSAEKKRKEPKSPARSRHGVVSKKEKKASYERNMKQIQAQMPASQRAFSKFIHNPAIEKTSEAVGSTVARPNAILAGAVVAFFLVLVVYVVAKFYGYRLSGFETIGAFIVGWIIGILYDFFRVMITGKKS